MHAVRDGFGSIIAPENLLSASFAKQELIAPLPAIAFKGVSYLVHRTPRAEGQQVRLFLEWLDRTAASSSRAPAAPVRHHALNRSAAVEA